MNNPNSGPFAIRGGATNFCSGLKCSKLNYWVIVGAKIILYNYIII